MPGSRQIRTRPCKGDRFRGKLWAYCRGFFQEATGTRYQFVFYRSNPQQVQDLIAGRLDLMFDFPASAPASYPQLQHQGLAVRIGAD